ncbi:MAG: SsrA-binding protein SmpB [Firmicutes bacterium]|nr:SsrA-binding protein SmpB [Bacillota bacterium]MBQ6841694.1 SsrA-binding protein SmpB [Bacillota bacterium]MBR6824208.1 SsrA-binding protein SmpB [Bacillota bacterium]MBR7113470.1 SsrA-binding protein SmpB [Bacillota bacterium]
MAEHKGNRNICENRRARHEYHFLEVFEAGISLQGTEVKSLRMGKGNLQDAYAKIENGECWLLNMHISPYEMGNRFNHQPTRPRRLLLHKAEIRRMYAKVREKGLTLVPVRVYFSGSKVKVELALAQGKKLYDKREDKMNREVKRDLDRAMKEHNRQF